MAFPDEFIGKCDLEKDPAIQGTKENIGRTPGHEMKIFDGGIIPSDHCFIGGEFLGRPVLAQVTGEAFINTSDITGTIRPAVPG